MFPSGSRIAEDYRWFEENLGPTVNAEILIDFRPGSIEDSVDQFRLVRRVDEVLRDLENVGGVISARTFLPTPPERDNRSLGATMVSTNIRNQIEREDSALARSSYVDSDPDARQLWRIGFRFPFGEQFDYRDELQTLQQQLAPVVRQAVEDFGGSTDLTESAAGSDLAAESDVAGGSGSAPMAPSVGPEDELQRAIGDGIRMIYTGHVPMTTKSQEILLRDLFRSFITAFGVVAVIMVLVLRSVVGGILAMFPNLFPTVILFGSMGLASNPLDIGSVMTASVALGIAVDATIHLLTRFGRQIRQGRSRQEAVSIALKHCGPAMWQTTAVCALSPLVYGLSQFVPTQRFALMMLGLLTAALVGDVIVMPAILASPVGRWLEPKKASERPD